MLGTYKRAKEQLKKIKESKGTDYLVDNKHYNAALSYLDVVKKDNFLILMQKYVRRIHKFRIF